ncbi:MAG: hypothetical protein NC185_10155, partial [Ruminococcus sp.]|nr:hypothetical protein [Ruminococcus sp.]
MNLINNYTDYTPLLNAEVFFFFKGVTNIGKNIKTKEKVIEKKTKGSVGKAADRTKIISVKAKDGIVEAKDKIQEKTDMTDDRSPEQYATEEVTEGMQKSAGDVGVIADKVVRTVKDKVKQKKAIDKKKKPKQRKQTPPKTRGELSVKKPKSDQQVVKYAHTSENKIKQTARSSASTKNRVKTAENSAKTVH